MNLSEAIRRIELREGKVVCAIEYEDGSRKTFNYLLVGETTKKFVRFEN